ncbi:MAG: hypothetical protein WAS54_05320 [Scrofimicrobium sp.]
MTSTGEDSEISHPESGMVTVELALGLGSLFLVLALILTAVGAGTSKAALCDQVRQEARAHSLGASVAEGTGSSISVTSEGPNFTVRGTKAVAELGGWSVGTLECTVSGTYESAVPWALLGGQP